MTISTRLGNLDLTKHIDPEYIEQVLALGSWCVHNGYIEHDCKSTKKMLMLHRYVYELANGSIPEGLSIDHIDGNKSNNFLSNLRVVTHQQNQWNHTKAKGYYWARLANKWRAQIRVNGKNKKLGYYDTEAEAHQAYLSAKAIYHQIPSQNALNQI